MGETNYQTNKDIILNEKKGKYKNYQKEYYKNNIELLKKMQENNIDPCLKIKKEAVRERAINRYHNMTDKEKQKLKDYQKEYRKNMTDEQKQKYKDYAAKKLIKILKKIMIIMIIMMMMIRKKFMMIIKRFIRL